MLRPLLLLFSIIILIIFTYHYYYYREYYQDGQQLNSGNFIASPYEWKEMEKKFKLDPVYKAIGGFSGQQRSTGVGSDWGWVWRGPMVWNGWKYSI